jgi:hypothetical protein
VTRGGAAVLGLATVRTGDGGTEGGALLDALGAGTTVDVDGEGLGPRSAPTIPGKPSGEGAGVARRPLDPAK